MKPRGRILSPTSHETDFTLKDRPQFSNDVRVTPSNQQQAEKRTQDYIDEHLFIEALALAAFEVIYREPQPSSIEKVSQFKIKC